MSFMHKKSNLKNIFRGLSQFTLSFLLLSGGFHFSEHAHTKEEGYSICNPECNSSDHHALETDCDECTRSRNNQKIYNNAYNINTYGKTKTPYHCVEYVFNKLLCQSSIASRAPPPLL